MITNVLKNPFRRWFLIFLVVANALGSVYGYYWYYGQLLDTPKRLWLFTFDSPLSSTLFAIVMLLILFGVNGRLLPLFAYTACIKYGIWAAAIIIQFWLAGGRPHFAIAMLLISHLGMAVEGYIFLRHLYVPGFYIWLLAAWFVVNDYMDYVVGVHPYLYYYGQVMFAMVCAAALSVLITAGVWRYRLNRRQYLFID